MNGQSLGKRWSDHDREFLGGEWRGDFHDLGANQKGKYLRLDSLTFEKRKVKIFLAVTRGLKNLDFLDNEGIKN